MGFLLTVVKNVALAAIICQQPRPVNFGRHFSTCSAHNSCSTGNACFFVLDFVSKFGYFELYINCAIASSWLCVHRKGQYALTAVHLHTTFTRDMELEKTNGSSFKRLYSIFLCFYSFYFCVLIPLCRVAAGVLLLVIVRLELWQHSALQPRILQTRPPWNVRVDLTRFLVLYLSNYLAGNGLFSLNQSVSPFYNWNLVYAKYCDGQSFSGNLDDPVKYGNQTLYEA